MIVFISAKNCFKLPTTLFEYRVAMTLF